MVALISPGKAMAAAPPYTLEERARAIAAPALVFIEAHFRGFMRSKTTGVALHKEPVTVISRCSGFVVSPEGHVITVTHCLHPGPDSLRGAASFILANRLIDEKELAPDQKLNYIEGLTGTTEFTGAAKGSDPNRRIFGQMFSGLAGLTVVPAIEAKLVEAMPPSDGDLALIKLEQSGMPVVEVSSDGLMLDAQLVQLGYGSNDTNEGATYTLRSRLTRLLDEYGSRTPAVYKMDGDLGNSSHGGMVVDTAGRVVGVVDKDVAAEDRTNFLVIDASYVARLLTGAGATNSMSPMDRTYREGLDAYFGGRYTEAIKNLDVVLASAPSHALAAAYRKQAVDRFAIEGDPPTGTPAWIYVLIGVFGILLAVLATVVIVMVLRARKARSGEHAPAGPFPPVPVSGFPISVQPVSTHPTSGPGYEYEPEHDSQERHTMNPFQPPSSEQ